MRKIFILSLSLFIAIAAEAKNLNKKVDVLVVCGGAGGTAAGIQSARSGAKTLIVEPSSWLGGMLTAAGVSCTDGNHDLPSGIWAEFRQKLYDRYGGPQAVATGWVSYTQFEPHVGDSIFKAMTATEKNLQVLYGYHFKKCILSGHLVQGAIFENGKNTLTIHAKIVIDGTELGDVMKASGTAYSLGMDSRKETGESMAPEQRSPIIQDITYAAILKD
ncbi:MAG: FAD-dependent oxidoreductase, partial [Bacteroidota bacterium]|nr:FAD-dependent oxidoreductase [Bacteroidota bacterium]